MRDDQAVFVAPDQEEADREEDTGDLLPEDAQADFRPEGAAGAGGAEVAISMKVHKGSAQAKSAIATGSRSASSGAAEKRPATASRVQGDEQGDRCEAGTIAMISDSFTAPCAAASSRVGTMRWSALVIERSMKLTRRLTARPEHDIEAVGRRARRSPM